MQKCTVDQCSTSAEQMQSSSSFSEHTVPICRWVPTCCLFSTATITTCFCLLNSGVYSFSTHCFHPITNVFSVFFLSTESTAVVHSAVHYLKKHYYNGQTLDSIWCDESTTTRLGRPKWAQPISAWIPFCQPPHLISAHHL